MKLEREKLQLKPFSLLRTDVGGTIALPFNKQTIPLTPLQYSYLEVLQKGLSIDELCQFFLGQGWLVHFRELYELLQILLDEKLLLNASFIDYFSKTVAFDIKAISDSLNPAASSPAQVDPSRLSFFRSLEPALAQYLLKGAEKITVPQHVRLLQAGRNDRDLYILLKGTAAIYKVLDAQQRQLIATLPEGSVFGEGGFLLNQPRNADVISTSPCEILRVKHLPEFDQLIQTDKAQSLRHRFWVMRALLSSELFKDLPTDSLDALVFAGRLLQASANQILFQEGQKGNACYILIQGSVIISQKGRNINVLNQGSCFGEISLLASGGVRTATVTTQRDCILMEIQQNDFYKVLSQNLILAKELESVANSRLQRDRAK